MTTVEEKDTSTENPSSTSNTHHAHQEDERSLPNEKEYLSGVKLALVLGSLAVATFLMMLDMIIITTAIPRITTDFHSLTDVGWYGAAYQLTSASFQPLAGKLFTHLKSKWVYMTFFAGFEIGSLICALSVNSRMLIIGRAVAGLGASGLMNGGLAILSACAPAEKQPNLLGVILSTSQLGFVVGPILGGAFTEYVSWRWCFWINLPVGGVVALTLVLIHIPDQIIKEKWPLSTLVTKLDLLGFGAFFPSAIMFFLALQYGGNQYAWNSPTVIGLFVGAGVMFLIFLLWEWRTGDEAMLPFSMVSKRRVWASCVSRFFYMGDIIVVSYFLPMFFQTVKQVSPLKSGYYTLPVILVSILFVVISSGAVQKLGYLLPWVVASGVMMTVGDGLYSTLWPSTTTAAWIGYQIICGCGNGLGNTMTILAVQSTLPAAEVSIAMALLIFSQNLGASVFLTFAETIFTNSLKTSLAKYVPGVNIQDIIAAGATGLKGVLSEDHIAGVLRAYAASIDHVFYLAIGTSIGALVFACAIGWVDVRKKKEVEEIA